MNFLIEHKYSQKTKNPDSGFLRHKNDQRKILQDIIFTSKRDYDKDDLKSEILLAYLR